jgi:hypothetical protein
VEAFEVLDLVDRMLVLSLETYASSSVGEVADFVFDLVFLAGTVAGTDLEWSSSSL